MDEPAIRMWAWEQMEGWGKTIINSEGKPEIKLFNSSQRIESADRLAAWVMTGQSAADPAE